MWPEIIELKIISTFCINTLWELCERLINCAIVPLNICPYKSAICIQVRTIYSIEAEKSILLNQNLKSRAIHKESTYKKRAILVIMVDYFNQIIHWTGLNLQINFVFIKKKKYEDYPGLLASTQLAPSVLTSLPKKE